MPRVGQTTVRAFGARHWSKVQGSHDLCLGWHLCFSRPVPRAHAYRRGTWACCFPATRRRSLYSRWRGG